LWVTDFMHRELIVSDFFPWLRISVIYALLRPYADFAQRRAVLSQNPFMLSPNLPSLRYVTPKPRLLVFKIRLILRIHCPRHI